MTQPNEPQTPTTAAEQADLATIRDAYAQLGLEHGASMREVETAYWAFARDLRGQPAMTPYTLAYQALVGRSTPSRAEAPEASPDPEPSTEPSTESALEAAAPESLPPVQPVAGAKFGWPV